MKTYVISIYDRVTKGYGNLLYRTNLDRIQDEFDDLCKQPDSMQHKYPQDHEVHLLGEFNSSPHHYPEFKNSWYEQPRVIATGKAHANS